MLPPLLLNIFLGKNLTLALVPHVSKMMTCIKIRSSPKDLRYLISLSIDKYAYFNCYHSVYWNIKKIELEKKARDDPKKFDKMIDAIKASDGTPGYSKVLWTVRWCC